MKSQRNWTGRLRQLLAMMLALMLLVGIVPGMNSGAYAAQNGMIRVKLTRVGSRSSLTIQPTCEYRAGNVTVPKGAAVKVSASGGALTMTVSGQTYKMGDKMTLARKGSGMTGFQFTSPSLSNLFCGDLVLYADGGVITPIMHMYIEDYLYGVVAYEMSNSYPLEALKAQAVAARNYAIMMANSRQKYTYDVTDNTNSQVYKGYNSTYKRVIQAVDETAGRMLYYNGSLAKCYYAASNGGQTDSTKNVWGGNLAYSVVKDDPYDLEATGARVKSAKLPKKPTSANPLDSTLRGWLIAGIAEEISKAGVTKDSVSIEEITSLKAHTPKYAAPSILFKKLKFTMDCTGKTADGKTVAFTADCDIDTYDKFETLFGLSINSGSNETVIVTEDKDSYTVSFRRYGHGIGMSQHGARIMALNYGKTYDEILEFYFPGTTLTKVSMSNNTGSTNINSGMTNTGAAFAAGDSVKVSLSAADSTLSLRAEPGMDSAELAKIPNGEKLTLLAVSEGWGKVEFSGIAGYISLSYVVVDSAESDLPETEPAPEGTVGVVKLSDPTSNLNVRASATTTSAVVTKVTHGTQVQVLEVGETWVKIAVDGKFGYVMKKYLTITMPEATPAPSATPTAEPTVTPEPTAEATPKPTAVPGTEGKQYAKVKLSSSSSNLNVRKSASASSAIVMKLKHGTQVELLTDDGTWVKIAANGKTGYVMAKYLVKIVPEITPMPEVTAEPTATPAPEPTAAPTPEQTSIPSAEPTIAPTAEPETKQYAKVKLSSASSNLNVRKSTSTSSAIVMKLKHGTQVEVLTSDGTWVKIAANGKTGYVMAKYLVKIIPEVTATPAPTATPTVAPTVEPTATPEPTVTLTAEPTATPTAEPTATPVPTATPEPTAEPETKQYAKVKLSSTSSNLNVRKSASASSAIVMKLKHGTQVELLTDGGTWVKIAANGKTGYVMAKYLVKIVPEVTATPVPTATPTAAPTAEPTATPTATPTAEPTATPTATPTAEPTATPVPTATPEPTAEPEVKQYAKVKLSSTSSNLNVRKSASSSAAIVMKLKHGDQVELLTDGGTWVKIAANGKTGYVMAKYLVKIVPEVTATPVPTATPTATPTAEPTVAPTAVPTATPTAEPTATPVPTATPEPTAEPEVKQYAKVKLSSTSSNLNVRKSASSSAAIVMKLKHGDQVELLTDGGTWVQISANGKTGYVMAKYLVKIAPETMPTPVPTVKPTTEPTAAPTAAPTAKPTETPAPEGDLGSYEVLYEAVVLQDVTLISETDVETSYVVDVPEGEIVQVVDANETWCYVLYGKFEGFVRTELIEKI